MRALIQFLKDNPKSKWNYFFSALYRFVGMNKNRVEKGNKINAKNCFLKKNRITVIGKNNVIDFGESATYMVNSSIYINGNNNIIRFGVRNYVENADIYIEDDNGLIDIGDRNRFFGSVHLADIEGETIRIGNECMFSDKVVFRVGDSHAIWDVNTGKRINPSKPIFVGNRVWFGNTTTILKNVNIGDDSIIGTCSVVTKDVPANTIVAGNPAKVIKEGVKWNMQRNV